MSWMTSSRFRFERSTLGPPLLLTAGGLYAIYAYDLMHDEAHTGASHHLRIETGELLLWATAVILILVWSTLRAYNNHRAERARRIAAEARAQMLGYEDPLTGIANRRAADEQLTVLLGAQLAAGTRLAVILLDLNGFKQINDRHGHATGDAVLKAVARRLEAAVRATDLAARIGGDEFVVLLPEVEDAVAAETVARRICVAIEAPIEVAGRVHRVSAGLGIALEPEGGGIDAEELLRRADVALYAAKDAGRGTWCFHRPELDVAA
jgi:diguanylate cyclase (GGDEF)-like protein